MRPTTSTRIALSCASTLAALFVSASCASTAQSEHSAAWLIAHHRYQEAVCVAAKRHDDHPQDAAAESEWRMATVALLLDQGRVLSFDDRDVEALEKFRAAQVLAPGVEQTKNWIDATLDKLATRWTITAQEWHAKNSLEQAIDAYEQALSFRDDRVNAKQGLERAILQLNYRNVKSDGYYGAGVAALDEYFLQQSSHDFNATLKYKEDHQRAEERKKQVASLLANDRVAFAAAFEESGQFAAARGEYRIATLIDPDHAEAKAGLERARKEDKAAEHLREAGRRTLHGDFEKAQKAIDEGLALTMHQTDAFGAAQQKLIEARLAKVYDEALSHETDRDYERAITAYELVLDEAERLTSQRLFKDAIARKDSLEQAVHDATELYGQLDATTDNTELLRKLRKIEVIWPEYRDVRQRIAVLEAATDGGGEQPHD